MENHPVARIKAYLEKLKSLVSEVDLKSKVYNEGTTAEQAAYHAAQSANFWLRVRIQGGSFERDKDTELTGTRTIEEINKSIDMAIEACDELFKQELDLNQKLKEEIPMKGFSVDSIGTALIFITSHTAEHVAELTMLKDYVSTLVTK